MKPEDVSLLLSIYSKLYAISPQLITAYIAYMYVYEYVLPAKFYLLPKGMQRYFTVNQPIRHLGILPKNTYFEEAQ